VNAPIRIMVVDDHAIVREGLRAVLERDAELEVVAEAGGIEQAMQAEAETLPDVVLLDLKLSSGADAEGLTLLRRLIERRSDTQVLVLTMFLEERLVAAAIHAGESAFDPHSAAAVVRMLHGGPSDRAELSPRELEILTHLAQGWSNQAIGQALYISESTVKFHVGNLMRKLDVTRRAEAVYAAAKQGLI
jgi:two-component system, NarL family, response regulator DevR